LGERERVRVAINDLRAEFAQMAIPLGQAYMAVGGAAMKAVSGMIDFNNEAYMPTDGSYPPDMDME
jgi:hypothetical protein